MSWLHLYRLNFIQNYYQSKVTIETQNPYLNCEIDPNFQEVNRLFVSSFGNNGDRKVDTRYFPPNVEIKDYNVMIDGQTFFDQPIKMIKEHVIIQLVVY